MRRAKRDVEEHLNRALEESSDAEVRYHLRQALQALAMVDDMPGPTPDNDTIAE